MSVKQQILDKAEGLFLRLGIRSVTMEELARELGISKKTLYQFVENKADLINQIILNSTENEKRCIAQFREESDDAIEEMLNIAEFVLQTLRKISPAAIYDLQKYYRESWNAMEAMHKEYIYATIRDNLDLGIEQGIYRSDLNPDIIAKLYVGKTSFITDEEIFPLEEYRRDDLYEEFINYHIHGIASPKGLELLEKHLNKQR